MWLQLIKTIQYWILNKFKTHWPLLRFKHAKVKKLALHPKIKNTENSIKNSIKIVFISMTTNIFTLRNNESTNVFMELDHIRPMQCRFCLRNFKYGHSLVLHLKELHMNDLIQHKQRSMKRISVIRKNPYYLKNSSIQKMQNVRPVSDQNWFSVWYSCPSLCCVNFSYLSPLNIRIQFNTVNVRFNKYH